VLEKIIPFVDDIPIKDYKEESKDMMCIMMDAKYLSKSTYKMLYGF
jgi:hypothetical protein